MRDFSLSRLVRALILWVVVALGLWLLAQLLGAIGSDITDSIASFLDKTNVVIGFLAALWYYFFGTDTL